MIRARLKRYGKEYSLGDFPTDKEVAVAKSAAARVLDRVEADKPAPVKPTYPSLTLVTNLVDMGVYDRHAESIMVLIRKLVKRHSMVTVGVQAATAPVQTLTMDEMEPDVREGRGPLLPQNRW
jgi:uncharacterized protein with ATP-grasp and redox domains